MKILLLPLLLLGTPVFAADPVIKSVTAQKSGSNWRFSVSLKHPDTGWDHYAYGWRIETKDGTVLGQRLTPHPHVHEQPISRSLHNVRIPDDVDSVFIRSKCSVDGWGEKRFELKLERDK